MGVLDELDYALKPANAAQRVTQKIAASGPGAWVFQRTMYPIDKVLYKRTNGRLTVPGLMAGLPVIMLTTTGAKTGQARSMPLVGIPIGDDLAVIGSNYGQKSTPGWVYNLEANPAAMVTYRDRNVAVVARRANKHGTDRAFEMAAAGYAAFTAYRTRAAHRDIRVFTLKAAT